MGIRVERATETGKKQEKWNRRNGTLTNIYDDVAGG